MDKLDLIKRCDECSYCPFETILTVSQRDRSVLDVPLRRRHPHRETIEQVCGKRYDGVCEMKYATMRAELSDFDLAQFGAVIKNFAYDCGKALGRKVGGDEAFRMWTMPQNLGRGIIESYAERFRDVWNLGLREFEGEDEPHQTLSELSLYERVLTKGENYDAVLRNLMGLKEESLERDNVGVVLSDLIMSLGD